MREVTSVQKIFTGKRRWMVCVSLIESLTIVMAEVFGKRCRGHSGVPLIQSSPLEPSYRTCDKTRLISDLY